MSKESRYTSTASNKVWYWNCGGTGDGVTASKRSVVCNVLYTCCRAHGSRFLHPEGDHHLEDVHYSLRLAPLNGGGYGTEHARAAHRVTAGNTQTQYTVTHDAIRALKLAWTYLQWTTTGWFPVFIWILDISAITAVILVRLEQLPSELQLVMWS